jgi:hypothetical protein
LKTLLKGEGKNDVKGEGTTSSSRKSYGWYFRRYIRKIWK